MILPKPARSSVHQVLGGGTEKGCCFAFPPYGDPAAGRFLQHTGDRPVADISRDDVREFRDHRGENLLASTLNIKVMSRLVSFFNHCREEGWVAKLPTNGVRGCAPSWSGDKRQHSRSTVPVQLPDAGTRRSVRCAAESRRRPPPCKLRAPQRTLHARLGIGSGGQQMLVVAGTP